MSGLLNLGSLVFGLIAWTLPVIVFLQSHKVSRQKCLVFSAVSISACAVSLCLQIFEIHHRVNLQDWSALMDTSRTVALVTALLLAVTIILNVVVYLRYYGGEAGN